MKRNAGLLLILFALVSISCAGNRGGGGGDNEQTVRGRIALRGSTPTGMLFLEADDGTTYLLHSERWGDELRRLDQMNVIVTGVVLSVKSEVPALEVYNYDLLALPSGEQPVVGVVRANADVVYVLDASSTEWVIKGDFADVLRSFRGAKVWIAGVTEQTVNFSRGSYRTMFVTEYGILRP